MNVVKVDALGHELVNNQKTLYDGVLNQIRLEMEKPKTPIKDKIAFVRLAIDATNSKIQAVQTAINAVNVMAKSQQIKEEFNNSTKNQMNIGIIR